MKFNYTLNIDDYIIAYRNILTRKPIYIILLVFCSCLVTGAVLSIIFIGMSPGKVIVIIITLSVLFYLYIVRPIMIGRHVDSSESHQKQTTMIATDLEVTIKTDTGEITSDWDLFDGFIDIKDYFILLFAGNPQTFTVVPKSSFMSPEIEDKFLQILVQNIKIRNKSYLVRYWYLVFVLISNLILFAYIFLKRKTTLP